MVTFDSPIERCTACGQMVLLDQTQKECAKEHGCGNRECVLSKYFKGIRFGAAEADNSGVDPRRRKV